MVFDWLKGKLDGFDSDKEYDQVLNKTGGETSDAQIEQDVKLFFQRLQPLLDLENLDPTTRQSDE